MRFILSIVIAVWSMLSRIAGGCLKTTKRKMGIAFAIVWELRTKRGSGRGTGRETVDGGGRQGAGRKTRGDTVDGRVVMEAFFSVLPTIVLDQLIGGACLRALNFSSSPIIPEPFSARDPVLSFVSLCRFRIEVPWRRSFRPKAPQGAPSVQRAARHRTSCSRARWR